MKSDVLNAVMFQTLKDKAEIAAIKAAQVCALQDIADGCTKNIAEMRLRLGSLPLDVLIKAERAYIEVFTRCAFASLNVLKNKSS